VAAGSERVPVTRSGEPGRGRRTSFQHATSGGDATPARGGGGGRGVEPGKEAGLNRYLVKPARRATLARFGPTHPMPVSRIAQVNTTVRRSTRRMKQRSWRGSHQSLVESFGVFGAVLIHSTRSDSGSVKGRKMRFEVGREIGYRLVRMLTTGGIGECCTPAWMTSGGHCSSRKARRWHSLHR
jgi:hypothetical protein